MDEKNKGSKGAFMSIKIIDLIQGSQEWLDFRKWKIGSSSAASIMGKGFKTPLQLFHDIVEDRPTADNAAMARGRRLEPLARSWLNEKYNTDLQPIVVQHPNPEFDWHISSIDGFCELSDGSMFVTEIKCPGYVDHQTALNGKVPEKYLPQLFHILEDLPGVDKILYFSYNENSQAEIWVDRHEDAMQVQFAEELAFYTRLLNFISPDPIDKDWVSIQREDMLSEALEYSFLIDQIADLEARALEIKNSLIQGVGNLNRAKVGSLKIQKITRKGAPQYSNIPELKNVNLDSYRGKPIISWRIYDE